VGREPRDRERGLAIYNFGNASAFVREVGWSPSSRAASRTRDLSVEDMIVLDLEGKIVGGASDLPPTPGPPDLLFREMRWHRRRGPYPFHLRDGWARQRAIPNPRDHTRRLPRRGCALHGADSAEARGRLPNGDGGADPRLLPGTRSPRERPMVLGRHGAFTWERAPEQAVHHAGPGGDRQVAFA